MVKIDVLLDFTDIQNLYTNSNSFMLSYIDQLKISEIFDKLRQ